MSFFSDLTKDLPPDPLPWFIIGFTIGIIFGLFLSFIIIIIIMPFICGVLFFSYNHRFQYFIFYILLCLFIAIPIGYSVVIVHKYISFTTKTLKYPLYNQKLSGTILSLQDQTRRRHILFQNSTPHPIIPEKIRFTISAENYDKLFPNDTITFYAHLYPLPSALYKGDYDFSFYAKAAGIGAIGSIQKIEKIQHPAWSLGRTLEELRRHIKERFHHHLSKEPASIMTAMITGDRSSIPPHINDTWKEAGIYHLLSISGLHMTVIAGLMFFLFRRMVFLCPPLVRHYDTKKIAAVASIICAGFYTLISGGAVPVIRSFITVSVMMCAILYDRQVLSIRTTSVAYLVILVFSPY